MTQISLSKAYAIIDEERGKLLDYRKEIRKHKWEKCPDCEMDFYEELGERLRLLNKLKKAFALVSDADQLPLGL